MKVLSVTRSCDVHAPTYARDPLFPGRMLNSNENAGKYTAALAPDAGTTVPAWKAAELIPYGCCGSVEPGRGGLGHTSAPTQSLPAEHVVGMGS